MSIFRQLQSQCKLIVIHLKFLPYMHFEFLGDKYIVARDYNAKHSRWGSRIITPRRRTQETFIKNSNLNVSAGKPTYWPSDTNKIPNVLDFAIIKGVSTNKLIIKASFDFSSDHTSLVMEYTSKPIYCNNRNSLFNETTKREKFKILVECNINYNIPLKKLADIECAVTTLLNAIHEASGTTISYRTERRQNKITPPSILDKIKEKRRVKAKRQKYNAPGNKKYLNKITKELKSAIRIHYNAQFTKFLESLPHIKILILLFEDQKQN